MAAAGPPGALHRREHRCARHQRYLRLDQVNPFDASEEYRRQQEKASLLYEKLREMLPPEGQTMLLSYGEALTAAHCLEVTLLTERAFFDGISVILRAMMNDEC